MVNFGKNPGTIACNVIKVEKYMHSNYTVSYCSDVDYIMWLASIFDKFHLSSKETRSLVTTAH